MDAVYMVGGESKMGDWELRYSLRSLVKHYSQLERVWIIGHLPDWLRGVSHIPQGDPYKSNKDANLIAKVIRLGHVAELSEDFLMMSDDHFLLKDCAREDFRPYYNKDMEPMKKENFAKNKWAQRLRRSRDALIAQGYPARDYEGHIPYPLKKSKVWTFLNFDYGHGIGYCVFTLYFNTVDTPNIGPINKGRVRAGFYGQKPPKQLVDRKLKDNRFLNFNDGGFTPYIQKRVEELFPEPSRFEQ